MAEKEKKTITIYDPSEQSSTISRWGSFGWTLEDAYDRVKQATPRYPGYHYVDLIFVRDPLIPHYIELVDLEKDYYRTNTIFPNKPRLGWLITIVTFFITFGIISGSDFHYYVDGFLGTLLTLILPLTPGIIISIIRKKIYKKKYAKAEKAKVTSDEKRSEILLKAQNITK